MDNDTIIVAITFKPFYNKWIKTPEEFIGALQSALEHESGKGDLSFIVKEIQQMNKK